MTNVLVLTTSAAGDASVSSSIVRSLVTDLSARQPHLSLVQRDLGASPVPHLTTDRLPGLAGVTGHPAAAEAASLSDTLIAELRAADLLVIGSPMYNFGITSSLKAWFDHVIRAGATFRYTAEGSVGLLTGKRAIVVESRGGVYSEEPAMVSDSQEPHLRAMLAFIGIADVSFVRAEGLKLSPEARDEGIAAATAQAEALVADNFRLAA